MDSRVNVFPQWSPDGTRLIFMSLAQANSGGLPAPGEFRSVAISGGAPQTILPAALSVPYVGRDGRLLFEKNGEATAYDPRDGKLITLGKLPTGFPAGYDYLQWSSDGKSLTYMIAPTRADDPTAGIWITDFKSPPRQVFHGWAVALTADSHDTTFILKGKADLNGELWKVKKDGSGLAHVPGTLPLLPNLNNSHTSVGNLIDVSPDGHYVAFMSDQVLQENIGIIDNVQ